MMAPLLVTALGFIGPTLRADDPRPPSRVVYQSGRPISPRQCEELHRLIAPLPGQMAWREEIPWLIHVREARELAAATGKPLFIWVAADGQPVGSC